MTASRLFRPAPGLRLGRVIALGACAAAFVVAAACGEDEAIVRPRLDAGSVDASTDDGGALACGVTRPTEYVSAAFETNANAELSLTHLFYQLDATLQPTDPDAGAPPTAADLKALFSSGTPTLRSASTSPAQTAVDGAFDAFEAAQGKTWTPALADQDGGASTGGLYGDHYVSATGLDLRELVRTTLLQGAFYNVVLAVTASPVNDAAVDRLLAASGATRAFARRTDADAGLLRDKLIAELASQRDDQAAPSGPYRKLRDTLLTMKGALGGGTKCDEDLKAAVAAFRLEWERVVFASAIFYLNQAASTITAAPTEGGPEALRSFSIALGLIESFRGIPADKRKINDAQIDSLADKIGAKTPWKLVTALGERTPKLADAITDIKAYQGFTDAEVESFKKTF